MSLKGVNSKYVYCDEAELNDKLANYIQELDASRADMAINIADAIDNVKNGAEDTELFNLVPNNQQNFFEDSIKKYLQPE